MTVSPRLFNAILAMDAYNRGYGAGIFGLSNSVSTRIGNASIVRDDNSSTAMDAGFYAIAYEVDNGPKIISYRGTNADSIEAFLADGSNGFGAALGSPLGAQAQPQGRVA